MENNYKPSLGFNEELNKDVERVARLFRNDQMLNAVLLYKLVEERENTNRLLKNLISKIEQLESKISPASSAKSMKKDVAGENMLLPEADEKIIGLLREIGHADAKGIADRLGYRGANGASARLNRLHEQGLVEKKRVGKKVEYFLARR